MQLGILSHEQAKDMTIEMGLVAYPDSVFKAHAAVTVQWRHGKTDYERPIVATAACLRQEELLEVASVMKAVTNLVRKHGMAKAIGHPAHLLDHLQKQLCRHVAFTTDGKLERIVSRKAGDKRYRAAIGGEDITVTSSSERAAESAISRVALANAKGDKKKAAAYAEWVGDGCKMTEVAEKVDGKDVTPLIVYSYASAREKASAKK